MTAGRAPGVRPLVVVGDAFLDRDVEGSTERLCPDAPAPVLDEGRASERPGGAALAAVLAAADSQPVVLVTALGEDRAGDAVREMLSASGVEIVDVGLRGPTPEKIRYSSRGQVLLRVDRAATPAALATSLPDLSRHLAGAGAVLVADYGRGMSADAGIRQALRDYPGPLVWDPHPKGAPPVPGVTLATPNLSEVGFAGPAGLADVTGAASALRRQWDAGAVAVTLGGRGALLVAGDGPPLAVPAEPVAAPTDTCGAGDRFASAAAWALVEGRVVSEAVVDAVAAASDFVAAGAARAWVAPGAARTVHHRRREEGRPGATTPAGLAADIRRRGGTVVATGGCFDLLHAGHLHLLRAARALGDCLIVCMNSDRSVQALKGPDRPVVGEDDRAAMLLALSCVDAVVRFDEQTPAAVLGDLQPHLFVKGGDYSGRVLPEAEVLGRWGGQVVTVPYLSGRSTTGLLRHVGASRR